MVAAILPVHPTGTTKSRFPSAKRNSSSMPSAREMPPAGSLVAKYEQGYASLCKHIFAVRRPSPFAFGWVGYCDWKRTQYDSIVKQPCTFVVEFVEDAVENVRAYAETKAGNDAETLMDKRAGYRLEELLRFLLRPGRVFRSAPR